MISTKIAAVIAIAAFAAGSILSPPVQEAIAAVIATDVQCTGCVGANDLATSAVTTTKLASNSVNGGKITDGTISAADLGPDSVGASELKGVGKIIFAECIYTNANPTSPAFSNLARCSVPGADSDDSVVATLDSGSLCFVIAQADPTTDGVEIFVKNDCSFGSAPGTMAFGIMVFDK